MSLTGTLLSGVAGLKAQTNAMAILSDNISNINTIGYKGVATEFRTLVTDGRMKSSYSAGGVAAAAWAAEHGGQPLPPDHPANFVLMMLVGMSDPGLVVLPTHRLFVQPAVATAPEEDVATWKKRLAGKDQALTATQKELAAIREEAEQLRKYKAEVEFANMSELEKATTRAKQLEAELKAARETAEQIGRAHV